VSVGSNVAAHCAIASAAVGSASLASDSDGSAFGSGVESTGVSGSILVSRVLSVSGSAPGSERASTVYYGWHGRDDAPILNNLLC